MSRRYAKLEPGKSYRNLNGGLFRCLQSDHRTAELENAQSGWRFTAHSITLYDSGAIEWDYSTGGHFRELGYSEA